jgi:hypothetical protein
VPWNGSGTYTRAYPSWGNDANSGLPISSTKFDLEDNDFASGIQNCLTIDGQNIPNATLNWKQQLNLTRGTDGNISIWGRTGGSNNPALTFSVADATGVAFSLSTAQQIGFSTGGNSRLTIGGTGAVVISAPTSGVGLTVNGAANSNSLSIIGSSTSGQSLGLRIAAGTTSADFGIFCTNQSGSAGFFEVNGAGVVQGNDGAGNLLELGYKGTPFNQQSSNYIAQTSDRGKSIVLTGSAGQTLTIPNSVFSAGDVFTIIANNGTNAFTIAQGSGVTIFWAIGGVSSGNRTLTSLGIATVVALTSSAFLISGSGLT